jgi:hypothetical protein
VGKNFGEIKTLNEILLYNPDYEVPDNYRKVIEKQLIFDYNMKKTAVQNPGIKNLNNWLTCYELVNDLVYDIFE